MIVLVTGGRAYSDRERVEHRLSACWEQCRELVVVQGGAKGADALARGWCAANGVRCVTVDAAWPYYDKKAGSIRNGWMLELFTFDFVIAFPGGTGTADMCRRARDKGITVYAG